MGKEILDSRQKRQNRHELAARPTAGRTGTDKRFVRPGAKGPAFVTKL